jgi:hypothetical protein
MIAVAENSVAAYIRTRDAAIFKCSGTAPGHFVTFAIVSFAAVNIEEKSVGGALN